MNLSLSTRDRSRKRISPRLSCQPGPRFTLRSSAISGTLADSVSVVDRWREKQRTAGHNSFQVSTLFAPRYFFDTLPEQRVDRANTRCLTRENPSFPSSVSQPRDKTKNQPCRTDFSAWSVRESVNEQDTKIRLYESEITIFRATRFSWLIVTRSADRFENIRCELIMGSYDSEATDIIAVAIKYRPSSIREAKQFANKINARFPRSL